MIPKTQNMQEMLMEIPPYFIWALIVFGIVLVLIIIAFMGPAAENLEKVFGFFSKLFMKFE